MHWGSIRSLVFGLPRDMFSAEVSKAQRDILKCARSGSGFFLNRIWAPLCWQKWFIIKQIIIYFCFIFPQAVCNFSFKCIHFSYGASLCAQLSYTSRAISPFLFISLWFHFFFSVVILPWYNVCFSYQVRAGAWLGIGAWPGGSKWEAIIWSAAVENEDHDDEGDYLDLKEDDEKWSLW